MAKFAELSTQGQTRILIIPWASESIEGAQNIKTELAAFTSAPIEIAPYAPDSVSLSVLIASINKSSGIFFTGGDQNKLMDVLLSLNLTEIFRNKYVKGTAFGGTSAGTAFMTETMITGQGDLTVLNGSQIQRTRGLGLLPPHIIVDQHFIVRSRFNRLAGVVLTTGLLGIGIDEGTSLLIHNNKTAKVIGPTQVLLFRPLNSKKLSLEVMENNEGFDISSR